MVAFALVAHPDGMLGFHAGPVPLIVIKAEMTHGDGQVPARSSEELD